MHFVPLKPNVEIRRSNRRRRTVSAYRDGDKIIVLVPARLSAADEKRWVATMLERLAARERRRRPNDETLLGRARELARRYLDEDVTPRSVRWVTNQHTRWGSCTPQDGSIRLSDRLLGMPGWVIDYVLIHELAHLRVPGHGPGFWALVRRYPKADRARGYLEGVAAAANLPIAADTDDAQDAQDVEDAQDVGHGGYGGYGGEAGHAEYPKDSASGDGAAMPATDPGKGASKGAVLDAPREVIKATEATATGDTGAGAAGAGAAATGAAATCATGDGIATGAAGAGAAGEAPR